MRQRESSTLLKLRSEISAVLSHRRVRNAEFKRGIFTFFMNIRNQHCFICRPSDSTVSEDAGIECRTVAILALAVRRSTFGWISSMWTRQSYRTMEFCWNFSCHLLWGWGWRAVWWTSVLWIWELDPPPPQLSPPLTHSVNKYFNFVYFYRKLKSIHRSIIKSTMYHSQKISSSVTDPESHWFCSPGSGFRIRIGDENPDPGARKLTKIEKYAWFPTF